MKELKINRGVRCSCLGGADKKVTKPEPKKKGFSIKKHSPSLKESFISTLN